MKILLDTHILLWHLTDNPNLSQANSQLIEDPQHQKFFSMASLWEIAIKSSLGKLQIQQSIEMIVPQEVIPNPLSNKPYDIIIMEIHSVKITTCLEN